MSGRWTQWRRTFLAIEGQYKPQGKGRAKDKCITEWAMDASRVDSAGLHLEMLARGKGNEKSQKSKMHQRITLQANLPPKIQF